MSQRSARAMDKNFFFRMLHQRSPGTQFELPGFPRETPGCPTAGEIRRVAC
jgi:hypothetical protein